MAFGSSSAPGPPSAGAGGCAIGKVSEMFTLRQIAHIVIAGLPLHFARDGDLWHSINVCDIYRNG